MSRYLKLIGKIFKYSFLSIIAILITGAGIFFYRQAQVFDETLIIEAYFMQYACGDENDDSKIKKISNPEFQYLVGTEIDPQSVNDPNYNLKDYIELLNEDWGDTSIIPTKQFLMKGRLGKYPHFGCDGTRKFIFEEISKLDGSHKIHYY